jgi:hypothetical protein
MSHTALRYFFAITNRGIVGLLRKYGEGASLIRGEWKRRADDPAHARAKDDDDMQASSSSGDSDADDPAAIDIDTAPSSPTAARPAARDPPPHPHVAADVDALAAHMDGLGIAPVPPAVRFGRGGRRAFDGAAPPPQRGRGARGLRSGRGGVTGQNDGHAAASMALADNAAMAFVPPQVRARGRGARVV